MIGKETAQLSQHFGVNDLDGTIDDSTKIYSMAGAEEQNPSCSTEELVLLIQKAGFVAVERDSVYNTIRNFTEQPFDSTREAEVVRVKA
jgi:aminodeoxyfutalosine synthase